MKHIFKSIFVLAFIVACALNGSARTSNFTMYQAEAEFVIHVQDALKNNARFPIDKRLKAIQSAQTAAPDIIFTEEELNRCEKMLKINLAQSGTVLTSSSIARLTIQEFFTDQRKAQPQLFATIRTRVPSFDANDYRKFIAQVTEQKAQLGDRFNEQAFAADFLNKLAKEKNGQVADQSCAAPSACAGAGSAVPSAAAKPPTPPPSHHISNNLAILAAKLRTKKDVVAGTQAMKARFAQMRARLASNFAKASDRATDHTTEAKNAAEKETPLYGGTDFVSRFVLNHTPQQLYNAHKSNYHRDIAVKKTAAALALNAAQASEDSDGSDDDEQPPRKKVKNNAASAKSVAVRSPNAKQKQQVATADVAKKTAAADALNLGSNAQQKKSLNHKKAQYSCSLCHYKTSVRCNAERHFIEKHIDRKNVKDHQLTSCKICKAKKTHLREHLKSHNSNHILLSFKKD